MGSPTGKMAPITGTYTQTSRENYEEMLKAIGVGMLLRKAAMASSPVMTISETGGNWTVLTKTTAKTTEVKFRFKEEEKNKQTHKKKNKQATRQLTGKF